MRAEDIRPTRVSWTWWIGATALLALTVLAGCAGPELETRTFEIRYADAYAIVEAVEPYVFRDRDKHPGTVSVARGLISVRETPDNLARIERLLLTYDRPRPSVRLHFKIIEANGRAGHDSAIADIERELRRLFRFDGYRLVGETVIAGIEGSELTQVITPDVGIRAGIAGVRGRGDSAAVQLEVLLLPHEVLRTSVTAPVGQTIVLGNAMGEGGGAMILTVRAELVEQ